MFSERSLPEDVAAVREEHAPGALVVNCERDFETLASAVAEELLLVVDGIDPASYPDEWVPPDAPDQLHRLAGDELTVGMPGDGGVAWTRQTDPPVVFVKPRLTGSPEDFVAFLVSEALVEVGLEVPEHFLGFFGADYPAFAASAGEHLSPAGTYQLGAALSDAWVGRQTRPVFADWAGARDRLHEAWVDAGERLAPRLSALPGELARGETEFPAAAELACAGVKHDLDLPVPFDALDTAAYEEHGPAYAVQWTEKTLGSLS